MKTMKSITEWIQQTKVYLLDKEKEAKVYEVQRKMQEILDEEFIEAKVEIKPCPLGMGDVIIQFQADEFIARNIAKFMEITKEFSNFEIYPINNKIQFAGVIKGVAKIIY